MRRWRSTHGSVSGRILQVMAVLPAGSAPARPLCRGGLSLLYTPSTVSLIVRPPTVHRISATLEAEYFGRVSHASGADMLISPTGFLLRIPELGLTFVCQGRRWTMSP